MNPNIAEVWYDLGTLYESCNNLLKDAIDAYARALELDPSNKVIKERLEKLKSGARVESGKPVQPKVGIDSEKVFSNVCIFFRC